MSNSSIPGVVAVLVILIVALKVFEPQKRVGRYRRRSSHNARNTGENSLALAIIAFVAVIAVAWYFPAFRIFLAVVFIVIAAVVACIAIKLEKRAKRGQPPPANTNEKPPTTTIVVSNDDSAADWHQEYLDDIKAKIGREGEEKVRFALSYLEATDDYIVLNDLILMGNNGVTTQIDHVVVSRYGIFVIETKCFKGWIFASADEPKWTQTLSSRHGVKKYPFRNPIRQNWRHICVLSERTEIPLSYFKSVVVFVGDAEFKKGMPENTVYVENLPSYIQSFGTPIIKDKQIPEIASAIREWEAEVTPHQRKNHVKYIKSRMSSPI